MVRKVAVLALAALMIGAWATSAPAYENCNDLGYFALEVPSAAAITIDGQASDWGWFDTDFIITTDDMCNTLQGTMPPKSDIDIAIRMGWTPEPDNRLYGMVVVVDDTMNFDETVMDNGWKDDGLEIILDPDHAGGWLGDDQSLRTGHQQWTFEHSAPGGYPQTAWLRFNQPPEMQWAIEEGLVVAATNVEPASAAGMTIAPDVTVGYEYKMPAWDPYMPEGEAASTRWILEAGQTLGMSVILDEADAVGRTDQIATHKLEAGAHTSDFTSEFTLLAVGEYVTAVESSSWGSVKALLR
ncbi:hypothetical protein ACFL6X_00270 [Candidatus Latescibacterota bacterium]